MNEKRLEQEQQEKEAVLFYYMSYLKTGRLETKQLEAVVIFDKKQTEFEQVAFRLEAIERVKFEQKNQSLNQYEKVLEAMHKDYQKLPDLLAAEYAKMDQPMNERPLTNEIDYEVTFDLE